MGYMLLERKVMRPHKADGVAPHADSMGILDYLRELRQESLPFAAGARVTVTGLESALLDAGANRADVVDAMHKTMAACSNELWQRRCQVQVVFDWSLSYGHELSFTRGANERVSLRPLFGNVRPVYEGGNTFYLAEFNLT